MHVCRYVYIYMYHYAHRTFYLCCSFTLLMYLVLCCVLCSILCSILSAGTLDVCIRLGHFMSARSKGRSPIIIIIIIIAMALGFHGPKQQPHWEAVEVTKRRLEH